MCAGPNPAGGTNSKSKSVNQKLVRTSLFNATLRTSMRIDVRESFALFDMASDFAQGGATKAAVGEHSPCVYHGNVGSSLYSLKDLPLIVKF